MSSLPNNPRDRLLDLSGDNSKSNVLVNPVLLIADMGVRTLIIEFNGVFDVLYCLFNGLFGGDDTNDTPIHNNQNNHTIQQSQSIIQPNASVVGSNGTIFSPLNIQQNKFVSPFRFIPSHQCINHSIIKDERVEHTDDNINTHTNDQSTLLHHHSTQLSAVPFTNVSPQCKSTPARFSPIIHDAMMFSKPNMPLSRAPSSNNNMIHNTPNNTLQQSDSTPRAPLSASAQDKLITHITGDSNNTVKSATPQTTTSYTVSALADACATLSTPPSTLYYNKHTVYNDVSSSTVTMNNIDQVRVKLDN